MWYTHVMECYSAIKRNEQPAWTSKILCWVEEARHRSHILYDPFIWKIQNKSIETESRLVAAMG